MNLPLLFARRYLNSRKSLSVINIISRVSIFAVGIPVAAMVILLSVFNGFEQIIRSMNNMADADLLITPSKGKVFVTDSLDRKGVMAVKGVEESSFMIEESVLMEYGGTQLIGSMRGVDSLYERVVPIRDLVVQGDYQLQLGDYQQALVGRGVALNLGVRTAFFTPLNIYVPNRGNFSSLLPMEAASSGILYPAGIFALDAQTDGQYIYATIDFARNLLDYPDRATALAVKVGEGVDADRTAALLRKTVGDKFKVQTRIEQKQSLYRIMRYEKWGVFLIIFLVMVIASFSIVGSLMMLIIDKRNDMRTVITMGGDVRFVRRIFTDEAMIITLIGAVSGLVLGLLFCLLQQQTGMIKIGASTFLVDAYPVNVQLGDLAGIMAAVIAVNWIIAKFTVARMVPKSSVVL